MFKERLRELSPPGSDDILIKQVIQPALHPDGTLYFGGSSSKTVDVQQIRLRFASLGVKVDWSQFEVVTSARNNAEHFCVTLSSVRVKEILADAMHIMHAFIRDELRREPVELLGSATWGALLSLADINAREQESCLQARAEINWGDPLTQSVSTNLRCTKCESLLLTPSDTSRDDARRLLYTARSLTRTELKKADMCALFLAKLEVVACAIGLTSEQTIEVAFLARRANGEECLWLFAPTVEFDAAATKNRRRRYEQQVSGATQAMQVSLQFLMESEITGIGSVVGARLCLLACMQMVYAIDNFALIESRVHKHFIHPFPPALALWPIQALYGHLGGLHMRVTRNQAHPFEGRHEIVNRF